MRKKTKADIKKADRSNYIKLLFCLLIYLLFVRVFTLKGLLISASV